MQVPLRCSKGLASDELTATRGKRLRLTHNVSRKQTRSCLTHIGLICNVVSLQPQLPHILLGNTHTLPQKLILDMQEGLPRNVRLWRRKSSLVNK